MIYKNSKDIYRLTAERLGIEEELVSSIGSTVWKKVNEAFCNFAHREMYILGFGVFRFRKKKSEKYLKKYLEDYDKYVSGQTEEVKERQKEKIDERIKMFRLYIDEWNDIIAQKKKLKDEVADNKRRIFESQQNLGGTEEQHVSE